MLQRQRAGVKNCVTLFSEQSFNLLTQHIKFVLLDKLLVLRIRCGLPLLYHALELIEAVHLNAGINGVSLSVNYMIPAIVVAVWGEVS